MTLSKQLIIFYHYNFFLAGPNVMVGDQSKIVNIKQLIEGVANIQTSKGFLSIQQSFINRFGCNPPTPTLPTY